MRIGYLGGMRPRTASAQELASGFRVAHGERELFLDPTAPGCRLFTWGSLALLIRGHVRLSGSTTPLNLDLVAEEVRDRYLRSGELPVPGLEGAFTLALLDGQAGRVLLFRNLAGNGFTYYHPGAGCFLFGSNLARLVELSGATRRCNRAALPAFFLYRFVPGAQTLFADFFRVLPGEQVSWDERGLTRRQLESFALGSQGTQERGDEVERLEEMMGRVIADCAQLEPRTATLLSGGVDSSYLQGVWNRVARGGELQPPSFSVSVDHPRTWEDTDYAMTAARALGTRHVLVEADDPYVRYLTDTIAATGEPPNHVQSAYFGDLAQVMKEKGFAAGLCGEGADSLFGVGLAGRIQDADRIRRCVPGLPIRRFLGRLAGWLGSNRWPAAFRLADRLTDYSDREHPVNEVACFTDHALVAACFGVEGLEQAAASRRSLLEQFSVPDTVLDRTHAVGFLGEAADSASLWTTLFNDAGLHLSCPFLDSRIIRLALELPAEVRYRPGRPKDLLKRALKRHVPEELVERRKLGFGQPIFEWLGQQGQLHPLVEAIGTHDFLPPTVLERARARPSWFLYSLLCYDVWHRLFIEQSLVSDRMGSWNLAKEGKLEACPTAGNPV
jgi:asparagine synthase (glutamine-hydrolysing)